MSIQSAINTLKSENDELAMITIYLNKDIQGDVTMLKSTRGIVGDNADYMIKSLKQLHDKLKVENNRHAFLIQSQTCSINVYF